MRASTHVGGGRGNSNRGSKTDGTSWDDSEQMDSQAMLNLGSEGKENMITENTSKECHTTALQVIQSTNMSI